MSHEITDEQLDRLERKTDDLHDQVFRLGLATRELFELVKQLAVALGIEVDPDA